ncbi:hypothetical protein VFPPC_08025 [Pochonia chlamydosporia 170]|uniref:Uncharacterized protein n=1 Tax=Pochonia chlamydosporia 170 TaxID=1380566 RepID=A0A179FLG1_METCM|nr:hypothetical protein VFPPC_08025 [Pochonia chlamydosporia 170]OAQ66475.1 hypothetical protein VFPPC_08025 [Pochonia chlamydosporia 170]
MGNRRTYDREMGVVIDLDVCEPACQPANQAPARLDACFVQAWLAPRSDQVGCRLGAGAVSGLVLARWLATVPGYQPNQLRTEADWSNREGRDYQDQSFRETPDVCLFPVSPLHFRKQPQPSLSTSRTVTYRILPQPATDCRRRLRLLKVRIWISHWHEERQTKTVTQSFRLSGLPVLGANRSKCSNWETYSNQSLHGERSQQTTGDGRLSELATCRRQCTSR